MFLQDSISKDAVTSGAVSKGCETTYLSLTELGKPKFTLQVVEGQDDGAWARDVI